jgi:drug/metabolite transporter (DMT)-like permease
VSVFLALTSAAIFGVADFSGAVSSRRTGAFVTAVLSQAVGLVGLLLVVGLVPGAPDAASMAWGAVGGLAGGLGLALFFRAMAVGPIGVVSPLTAAVGAMVPLVAGVVLGAWPEPVALGGIALGIAAVVLATGGSSGTGAALSPRVVLATLTAGACFGGFFVAIAQSDPAAGLWPLVGARSASLLMFGVVAAATRRSLRPGTGAGVPVLVCGGLDMVANVAFLYAVQNGLLAISGVLASLGPLATILLARVVLGEQLRPRQRLGVGLAIAAVSCVALA